MCEQGFHQPNLPGVHVKLNNSDLWQEFHDFETEMIITKSGRRMFPYLRLEISGLDSDARYFVLLEFNLSSSKRYKFNGVQWTQIGNAEPQLPPSSRLYMHPDSPAVGRHWMSQSVLFNKVKLTNHTLDRAGNIVLTSMHKYLPTVHIIKTSDVLTLHWSPKSTFTFKETEFIAVTAYQNERVTKLKIDNNPFAKGFRECGKSRLKRKFVQVKEEEEEKDNCRLRQSPVHTFTPQRLPLIPSAHADDSGISSVSSATPPMLDSEDILRPSSQIAYDNFLNQRSQIHHHHSTLSWMDLPLPPYPIIPPYCPTLWPYSPFLLPPPPPHFYPYHLSLPSLSQVSSPTSDSCLIDLSMPKDT